MIFKFLEDLGVVKGGPSTIPKRPKYISKSTEEKITRKVEEKATNMSEPLGNVIKKINNLSKTSENMQRGCDISGKIADIFDSRSLKEKNIIAGDHIFVRRSIYEHHGIYIGDGEVIHFTGNLNSKKNAIIQIDSIKVFANGGVINKLSDDKSYKKYSRKEICRRAYSKCGQAGYNLLFENCEHFARWCRNGD